MNNYPCYQKKCQLTALISVHEQPFGGDDSDVGSPRENHDLAEISNSCPDHHKNSDSNVQPLGEQGKQKKGNTNALTEMETSNISPAGECYRSMGEILNSMDPGNESSSGKPVGKVSSSNINVKRTTFWGRSNVSF